MLPKNQREKKLNSYLWCEKFRPQTIKDVIFPKSYESFFKNIIKNKEIPNLLLSSNSPGTAKTTTARAICNDLNANYLYINTSSEGGVDTLRTRIIKFATTKSIYSNSTCRQKIVILDEFDFASPNLQAALRASMEELSEICRFILTCNYKSRIIEAIQSRCEIIDFNMTEKSVVAEMKPKIVKRLCGVLSIEEVRFEVETIEKIVETFYPDMRKMLNILQQYSIQNNNIVDSNIFNFECVEQQFFDMILKYEFQKARQYIIESNHNIDEMYRSLNDNLLDRIPKDKIPPVLTIIAEYMYRNAFVIDKEINFAACLMEIIGALQS